MYLGAVVKDYITRNSRQRSVCTRFTGWLPATLLTLAPTPPIYAQSASLPAPLSAAITPSASEQLYAYEFILEEKRDKQTTMRVRIDPSRPEGDRVEILEAKGEDVDAEKLDERLERNADGDIWCDSIIAGVEGPVTDKGATAAGRSYEFTPKARPDADSDERKLFRKVRATVVVDETTNLMRTFAATLGEPWKPNIMAKINSFNLSGQCAAAPNGRGYAQTLTTRINISAVGQTFNATSIRRIVKLDPVS